MSSVRKRKHMLKRLHTYFQNMGRIPSEAEYMTGVGAPYRKETIKKFLGGWPRMINYLQFYYPQWKDVQVEEPVKEAPKINLDALEQDDDE